MAKDYMNYGGMVQDALRGVVRQALTRAAAQGLPGNHHLYLSFKSNAPGVDIPDYLRERYPDEMTIVLQHQYWGLAAHEDCFEVQLNFNKMPERLEIPYAAMTGFFDPSVQFGLQFQPTGEEAAPRPAAQGAEPAAFTPREDTEEKPDTDTPPSDEKRGEVLTLDAFRKK
ncbi:ClpXP protease specificity-enhancing factor SspB [Zavarzinia compransoris]|uniref:SspB family protein n=1 Tax=Zavarzinia marina TaxID=2911065 RepID=UPI001F32B8F3|nr:ClpXP protease specificity-enhancing factor SspB [Zavarzinia marina]MCF4164323.1 ClpXP protease specificity-enhancing factor SspB [Zavarzinia marina]